VRSQTWTPIGLIGIVILTLILQLTVGKDNNFGFACFIIFALALIALLVLGIRTIFRHRTHRHDTDN
jgi:biotin transporter BioY